MNRPWNATGFGWIAAVLLAIEVFLMALGVAPADKTTIEIGFGLTAAALLL